jgi:hypothetical protein
VMIENRSKKPESMIWTNSWPHSRIKRHLLSKKRVPSKVLRLLLPRRRD